jgi:RNase P/RNase MRP subunit p29
MELAKLGYDIDEEQRQAKLVHLMFAVEDTKKQLRTGIYGGVSKEEMEMVLDSEIREKEIYEYILDALDNKND